MTTLIPLLFSVVVGQPFTKATIEQMKEIADGSYAVQYYSAPACERNFAGLNNDSTCDDVRAFLKSCDMVPVIYQTGENVDISTMVQCK
ncbi:hypothetical protein [Bdellovibrio sp. NC01]|uniref:hypothetical protein n=1 Tax=Bdellovibrio sp. NC01 TaxID=2220073 RepID=UPI00115A1B9E|nr:hypothetical protein [Bdellovibrio sp. NC01]QDK38757.1 hypothetical protein DOE51_14765 [Bdellovibrio sp. NC01]